jgi:hypothetical protein
LTSGCGEDLAGDEEVVTSELAAGECRFSSSSPRGTVTLSPSDSTRVGYDFSTRWQRGQ